MFWLIVDVYIKHIYMVNLRYERSQYIVHLCLLLFLFLLAAKIKFEFSVFRQLLIVGVSQLE